MKKILTTIGRRRGGLIIAGLVAVGVLLLMFPSSGGETQSADTGDTYITVSTYTEKLEERIRSLCLAVDGVDEVSVLVTLESGSEYVYADNRSEELGENGASSYTSDYLIIENKDGTSPVTITEIYPKIRGVAVVCRGGDSISMQVKLTELLSAALGVSTNRIKVTS